MVENINEEILFSDIITNCWRMKEVFNLASVFAKTNDTMLITGETGTGKDVIAKKIYELSSRKDNPFVSVNLASISPTLFESELFGHIRGSYTGATGDKIGYFERANHGTIFLDEVGELPISLQGKLLRIIQYGELYRIGDSKPILLDIRIISATNKDLTTAINNKEFRADLYYRLTRSQIHLPALRERGNDIILLTDYFIKKGNILYNKNISGYTDRVMKQIMEYEFPGNIRELENIILNTIATTDSEIIDNVKIPKSRPSLINNDYNADLTLKTLEDASNDYILHIVRNAKNNTELAGQILGISRRTLQRKLKSLRSY